MTEHIDKTVSDLQLKLKDQEEQVVKTKQLINLLCEHAGRGPIYAESELDTNSKNVSIASDEFYGQPLATAMRSILEKRKAMGNGPATPRELYDSLLHGGYLFETDIEENRLIGVRVSLRKSSKIFHKLPDGKRYGLLEWYPKAKKQSVKNDSNETNDTSEQDDANPEEGDS
tara:strand:- start:290 stop:805 length:516 start_codon:yes stop_codon:yes gene_type:complete